MPMDSRRTGQARRAGFVLDLARCVGCAACVVACRLRNGWPSSSPWRRVLPLNEARRPAGPTYFLSVACHHCERPACLSACPSGAYEQREDGVVVHREDLCLGCRYCEMACPFGAPQYDRSRAVMTKCDFCRPTRAADSSRDEPACVAACPTEALRVATCLSGATDPDTTHRDESVVETAVVPGFTDPALCRPAVRFKLPRGLRGERLARLLKTMDRRR